MMLGKSSAFALSLDPMYADFAQQSSNADSDLFGHVDSFFSPSLSILMMRIAVEDAIATKGKPQDIIQLLVGNASDDYSRETFDQGCLAWTPVKTPNDTTLGRASLNFVLPDKAACKVLQQRQLIRLKMHDIFGIEEFPKLFDDGPLFVGLIFIVPLSALSFISCRISFRRLGKLAFSLDC
jgi:hypothetical protein